MLRPCNFPGSTYLRQDPPQGFGVRFMIDEAGMVVAQMRFDSQKEGPPGHAHGGALAAVLDEAMGVAAFEAGRTGYTATMTTNYRAAVPLELLVDVRAWITRIERSKTFVTCELRLPDGSVAVEAHALFIMSEALQESIRGLVRARGQDSASSNDVARSEDH